MSEIATGVRPGTCRSLAGKYLLFKIGAESFGIAVAKIREIIRLTTIAAVPQMPSYVKGVINLRGKIIPVVDLRIRFGVYDAGTTEQNCIVIVQISQPQSDSIQVGLIVDSVEEVADILQNETEETPYFGARINTDYILGMAKVKGCIKTLLDIDLALTTEELQGIQTVA